jgi:hypothetical protein
LFTLFNNHLKSNFVDYRDDPVEGARKNNRRRQRQAEVVAEIVLKRTRPNSRFAILGDMNDAPDSSYLTSLTTSSGLDLTNALTDPKETRPTKESKYPPSGPAWTHRYKQKAATCSMNSTTRSGSVHRSPRGRLVPGFIAVKISPAMDPTMIRHGLS